jgi:acid phosphatase
MPGPARSTPARTLTTLATALLIAACSACSGAPAATPPTSTGTTPETTPETGTGTGTAQAGPVPRPEHVVVVVEENRAYRDIIGNPAAPYLNALAAQGASFTAAFAETHPSQPNYLALFSGGTQGLTDDSCPHTFGTGNLGAQLITAGLGFTGWSEGLPRTGDPACTSGHYARKHNPWSDFGTVAATASRPFSEFPADYTQLPTVSFVIPDLTHDMHDGTITAADTWLRTTLDGYLRWAATHHSLLVVTWDEDDNSATNQIPTVLAGQSVKPGQYGERVDHYSILRTLETAYGLPALGSAGTSAPITDCWTTG